MNPGVYDKVLYVLKELNIEYDFAEKVETDFRWDIYPIQCSPFMKEEDYDIYTKLYKTKFKTRQNKWNVTITNNKPIVYILLGYGAGNIPYKSNQDKNEMDTEHYSPMNFVREVIKDGNIVVLTSHVQQETPDLDYDVSVKYIEEGVLFGGDMTLAEIMIKCAYLLDKVSTKESDELRLLKTSIMAGVGFRGKTSRLKYINLLRKYLKNINDEIDKLKGKIGKKLTDDEDAKLKQLNEMKARYNYILPDKNYFKDLPYQDFEFKKEYRNGAESTIKDLIKTVSYE